MVYPAACVILSCLGSIELISPAQLAGRTLRTGTFTWSTREYDLTAPIVLTERDEWSYESCPPRYAGAQDLRGAIVLHSRPLTVTCSNQMHTKATGAVGAIAWFRYDEDRSTRLRATRVPCAPSIRPLLTRVQPTPASTPRARARHRLIAGLVEQWPGLASRLRQPTDDRHLLAPIGGDVTSRDAVPLAAALRAGVRATGRMTFSLTTFEALFDSPFFILCQLLTSLGALALAEMAFGRLIAYARADGARLHNPQMVMVIELTSNLARAVYMAVDPVFSRGIFVYQFSIWFQVIPYPLGMVTTALMLGYYSEAASAAGIASFRLTARYALSLYVFAALSFALFAAVSVMQWTYPDVNLTALVTLISITLPFSCLVIVAWLTEMAIRRAAKAARLPSQLVSRIGWRVRINAGAGAVMVVIYLIFPFAFGGALFWIVSAVLQQVALMIASWANIAAFVPAGVAIPAGPFGWLARFARSALVRAWPPRGEHASTAAQLLRQPEVEGLHPALLLGVSLDFCREYHEAARLEAAAARAQREVDGGAAGRIGLVFPWWRALVRPLQSLPTLRSGIEDAPAEPDLRSVDISRRVARETLGTGSSLAHAMAIANAKTESGATAVGRATVFVSHAQVCSFGKLLDALDLLCETHNLDPKRELWWLDIFVVDQSAIAREVQFIPRIESQIGRVALVCEPWDRPVCFTRAWCLYEAAHCGAWQPLSPRVKRTLSRGRLISVGQPAAVRPTGGQPTLHLTMARSEKAALIRAVEARGRGEIEQALAGIKSRGAQCSHDADRDGIRQMIIERFAPERPRGAHAAHAAVLVGGDLGDDRDDGGAFEQLDHRLRDAFRSALAAFSWA
jgi:hypothetical protein